MLHFVQHDEKGEAVQNDKGHFSVTPTRVVVQPEYEGSLKEMPYTEIDEQFR